MNGQSRNAKVTLVVLGVLVALVALVLLVAMLGVSIKESKPALGYMAPLVSTGLCPKVGEPFSLMVKGDFGQAVADSHRLKLVRVEPRGGQTKFMFLPIAEGPVSIHLTSAGYWPETIERRVSRFTEDAWSIKNDLGQQIEIKRDVWLKSDDYCHLWFDNELVGGSYPVTHYLFVADLTGNPNDRESLVWTTSPNMRVDNERTRGNEFLEKGRHGYRFTTRVWVVRIPNTPGSGWVRISWKELWRTITIPDPHSTH